MMLEKLRALFRIEKPAPLTYYRPSGAVAALFDHVWSQIDPTRDGGANVIAYLSPEDATDDHPAGIYHVHIQMLCFRPGIDY